MIRNFLALVFCAGCLPAAVINFEDLGVAAGTQLNPAINVNQNSGGFIFSSTGADLHFHNNNGLGDNGSTHLGAHGFVDFAQLGGGTFSLQSFLFDYNSDSVGFTVIGQLFGGGTTSQSFNSNGTQNSYELFNLNNTFVNLTSVRIDSGVANTVGASGFFVDNITVNGVPEPASAFLVAAGLLSVALLGRRRHS